MSYTTITQAARDQALQDRVTAAVHKETYANPEFGDSWFGEQVKQGAAPIQSRFAYPIAVDTEAAYESAVIAGNENPGGDPAVITDAAIGSAVQANWPEPPDVIVP
jgi:hypothetical protein